jgi:23S rRNA (pseudouridine1915-N3)-methyltransferase
MKLRLLYIQSSKEPWAEAAEAIYAKKLRAFGQFEALALKAKSHARAAAELKRSEESQLLASRLEPHEINVLFDERGKSFSSSESFSGQFQQMLETSKRINLFIGGAYGVDARLHQQFHFIWSFSGLTMNHHLAKTVALEQVYRAMTIIKGIPYHNA